MKKLLLVGSIFFVIPLILIILISVNFDERVKTVESFQKPDTLKYCNSLNYEKNINLHPEKFSAKINLGLAFESERAWKRNLLNSLIRSEKNRKESDNWRLFSSKSKRQKGYIFLDIPGKLKCKIEARIRDHGDLMDQRDGTLLPSLNVHLVNGHIFGITKFILFLPDARYGPNEIFAANLFEQIGILSPKTMFVDVQYGKSKKKFIFQEKIQKELLESNYRREGPILEGDERFAFWDERHSQNLSKNKVVNVNWSKKNKSSYEISESSISFLNHLVQLHDTEKTLTDNLDYHTLEKEFFDEEKFVNLDVYDALSISMGNDHVMPRNERRFYFEPLFKKYYPIYYDGMYTILESKNPYLMKGSEEIIIPSAKTGARKAYNLISNINFENFYKKLILAGLDISKDKTKNKIEEIKDNLILLENYDEERIFKIRLNKERNPHVLINEGYDRKIKRKLIFHSDNFNNYLSCDIFGENCTKTKFNKKDKTKLVNQELKDKDGNNLIFVGKKRDGSSHENWVYQDYFKKNKTDILENEVKIIVFGEPEVQIDKTNKKISIKRIKEDDRVVLNGGILRNWEIQMRDFTDFKKLMVIGFDKNNLTGCLNFYDINLIDVKLYFENSNCEDAINFVRAKGSVREMNIQNSSFDAMDADFSKLQFNNLKINKSLNDCLDFSFGEYEIYNSEISNCADKAISVGELSKVKINKVSIKNSESGVVSKDFASVHISESRIFKTEYCFQAYNKKPEFSGGLINSKNNNCIFNHEFALVDLSSKLILNNEDYSETEWKNKKGKGEYNGI